jgi:hypothetical protein
MTNPSVNYEAKKRIVQAGESRICNNWVEHTDVTPQDFLEALEWVCEDPFDEEGRITREIGLEQNRIVRLQIFRDDSTGLMSLVDIEVLKKPSPHRWEGAWFADGFYRKILLSAKERV